ncbi:hypothetical protein WN55_09007, partial [Dufourea novaeangliae]
FLRKNIDGKIEQKFGPSLNWTRWTCSLARCPSNSNPLDFFLQGTLKNKVYVNAPTIADNLYQRITRECENIILEILSNVQHSFRIRLQKCVDANGHYFEHIL